MDETLLLLLKKNAHLAPLRITTSEIGKMLGMSQQNASRKIRILEESGLAARTREGISLTKKGMEEAYGFYSELKGVFERETVSISGTIIPGLGEGKYYMSFPEYRKQMREKLGFEPYAGTLNIKLSPSEAAKKSNFLKNSGPIIIGGFKKRGRTFGNLFAYPCKIGKFDCVLVVPLRTHHPAEVIEIVSPANLKRALGKNDGDEVKIEFQ